MAGTNDKHKGERGESARLVSFRILPLRDDCARMFQAPLLSSPFLPSPASAHARERRPAIEIDGYMWFELTVSYTLLLFDIPVAGSQTAFFLLAKFRHKAKSKIAKARNEVILQGFSR